MDYEKVLAYLVFPFEENNAKTAYLNSFFWSEEKGLLAFSFLEDDSCDYYFYRKEIQAPFD